jgi:hypothetical protein
VVEGLWRVTNGHFFNRSQSRLGLLPLDSINQVEQAGVLFRPFGVFLLELVQLDLDKPEININASGFAGFSFSKGFDNEVCDFVAILSHSECHGHQGSSTQLVNWEFIEAEQNAPKSFGLICIKFGDWIGILFDVFYQALGFIYQHPHSAPNEIHLLVAEFNLVPYSLSFLTVALVNRKPDSNSEREQATKGLDPGGQTLVLICPAKYLLKHRSKSSLMLDIPSREQSV